MNPLFQIIEDFSALSVEELQAFIEGSLEIVESVAADHTQFLADGRDIAALMDETTAGVAAIELARTELAGRTVEPAVEPATEIDADALAALAARARGEEEPAEPVAAAVEEPVAAAAEPTEPVEPAAVEPVEPTEPVAAAIEEPAEPVEPAEEPAEPAEALAAAAARHPLPRPARSRAAVPPVEEQERIALVACAENLGPMLGEELDAEAIADMMIRRRGMFGNIATGTHGEKIPIARSRWSHLYGEERTLGDSATRNLEKIEAVVASGRILEEFLARRKKDAGSLTASGGLCAPVTPYYQLQMLSEAMRPVRAALPAFNADRGGIQFASPAALTDIDTAVGIVTEAEDAAGGTIGAKSCQRIDCPPFSEVDVSAIYHCLEFGNLGARTFPELLAQWTSLTLAQHSRVAEGALLDGIRAASTKVTAANTMGLGISAQLLSQIRTAAAAQRSRHRMAPETVLRTLLPAWVLDALVSDVIRGQFGRFDMTPERFVAEIREANVEPSFYVDTAAGRGQVFGAQAAASLVEFPSTVEWYLYPEGSFLYLDGGVLELGLVRDSALNETNDFQIFGETWENVAFIGIESLAVTTTVDDRGTVSAPVAVAQTAY